MFMNDREQFAAPDSIIAKRFWDKVDIKGQWECWNWLAAKDGRRTNYGRAWDGEKPIYAHILAYKLTYGNYSSRFANGRKVFVRHLCGNYRCVNPNHLSLGTAADNSEDIYRTRSFNQSQRRLVELSRIK